MGKYTRVAKNTWNEVFTYRLSFVLWRIRVNVQIITMYFLWLSLIPQGQTLFGYNQAQILTYILGTSLIGSIILASRTWDVGVEINNGNLSNFLVRPINYFLYYFWKDLGDKLMNISFSITELAILFFLLNPPLFIQTDPLFLLLTVASCLLGVLLYFFFNMTLGMIGFWSPEVWAPRFIFFILITFFSGGLFPLDILPTPIYNAFRYLPFPYLQYFPLKIYLGQLSASEILHGVIVSSVWIGVMFGIMNVVWAKGLKSYTAQGR